MLTEITEDIFQPYSTLLFETSGIAHFIQLPEWQNQERHFKVPIDYNV